MFADYSKKILHPKIIYYGPKDAGKNTNVVYLRRKIGAGRRKNDPSVLESFSLPARFEFALRDVEVRGFSLRFQVYAVPAEIYYHSTREIMLKGADGVVFVADSQAERMQDNLDSMGRMREELIAAEINPDDIPLVIQYNKRDLPDALPLRWMTGHLNQHNAPEFEAVAIRGEGVIPTFKEAVKWIVRELKKGK